MLHRQPKTQPAQLTVYTVEILLERHDGSRAHDQKWIVATCPEEAEAEGLASAARRWPGHTLLGVNSVRVDHSPRARRFLRRSAHTMLDGPPQREPIARPSGDETRSSCSHSRTGLDHRLAPASVASRASSVGDDYARGMPELPEVDTVRRRSRRC